MVMEDGPVEISQVARALNEMRRRVTSLIDERTQILVAISHDLRTPLTRLRLRVERLNDADEKNKMLRGTNVIRDLLTETLTFFRDDAGVDPSHLADVPSILKTIRSEFSDVGYNVTYDGLHRFDMVCRPSALTRAITNIVDNATRYGSIVGVCMWTSDDGHARIAISDDGRGIPENIRSKVFVPFFRGDMSRGTADHTGFGLGLSIARDIIESHGGHVSLSDDVRRGTKVDITLAVYPERSLGLTPTWPVNRPYER
jgi:signal transduction histidine kinase